MPIIAPSAPLDRCARVAVQAARRAGPLLAAHAGHPPGVGTKRNFSDLVTAIDRFSERLIHQTLRRAFPSHGFLGEERIRRLDQAPAQWVVDPIDGTTNFVHGVPLFAISIGLLQHGVPSVGVIYDPIRREMFVAVRGRGAFLNGRRLRVSQTRRISQSLLSTGFSARFRAHPEQYLAWFRAFQARCHAVRRLGSTALSLAYVAAGRLDGFYEQDLWPWDVAAGLVLVQEAGGRVSNFLGKTPALNQGTLVATNGRIHQAVLRMLTSVTTGVGKSSGASGRRSQSP